MKATKLATVASIIAATVAPICSFAVPDTKIAIRCPDVEIWWPSTNGQTFLIQIRPDLQPETLWATLTNFYPAAANTNVTYFVHPNQVDCPTGQVFGIMSASRGGGSGNAQENANSKEKASQFFGLGPWVMPQDGSGTPVPLNIYPYGVDLFGKIVIWPDGSTEEWTQEFAEKYAQSKSAEGQNGPQPQDAGGDGAGMAFYRVIDVTPRERSDIYGVEQDTFNNQLDILSNDTDPNDDRLLISNVTSAQHGSISYTPDGTTFHYTPDTSFYGTDTFNYTATNMHGSWATATVTVFVNQSGNSRPVVGQTIFTLETNSYAVALNVLTNAFDPDGDATNLFSISTVRLGTLSSNGGSNVLYQRNPDWFGRDEFTFVVTDGRGGHDIGTVTILQVDADDDGMADEWEVRNGIDPLTDDSAADPDSDGLPNLGEYKLQTNPNAADNPLTFAVPNSSVSGYAKLLLAKVNPVIEMQPIALFVEGERAANSFLSQGPDGVWTLNWNTTVLTNGNYSVKAGFQYKSYSALTETNTVFGNNSSVQVTNLIAFDSFTRKFNDFLLINATLAVQNASCRVDLRDEDGTPLVYGVFSTTNGQIQLYWDLTDGGGNQISFGSINSEFRIGPLGTTNFSSLDPVLVPFIKDRPTIGNGFVVAWGWDVYNTTFNNRREQLMLDGVINLIDERIIGGGYRLAPAANVALATAFRYDSETDKKTLLTALKDSNNGNFFWFGHGSSTGFAGNENTSLMVAADVELALKNFAYKSSPQRPQTNAHPYRLVILNGCESYSAEWANAFGIEFDPQGGQTDVNYILAGRPQRAFVGWTEQIDVPGWRFGGGGNTHPQYTTALQQLFFNWMQGYFLNYSVNQFANTAATYGFSNSQSNRISGCVNMTR